VRGRIEAVLDFAKTRGYRSGENPAAWDGNLAHALPARATIAKVEHHAALAYSELPDFMDQIAAREGAAARALEFTILTAVRTGEVIGALWSEMDLEAKIWTIPAERMKAKKEHRVPLTGKVVEILNALPREANFVFPGGRANIGKLTNHIVATSVDISPLPWFEATIVENPDTHSRSRCRRK
jgi:integrase